jgi:pantothenate kinase
MALINDLNTPRIHATDGKALAQRAYQVLLDQQKGHGPPVTTAMGRPAPIIIGIGGGPGSGKSTTATKICKAINDEYGDQCSCIVLSMDGYHLSQQDLRHLADKQILKKSELSPQLTEELVAEHKENEHPLASPEPATFDDLMKFRGAPWSFDANALIHDLHELKVLGSYHFATYDRHMSDPRPASAHVTDKHHIVLVEGLYVVAWDDPMWQPLQNLFHDAWLVTVDDEEAMKRRLVDRHLKHWNDDKTRRFGPGRAGAQKKVDEGDMPNFRFVMEKSCKHATLLVDNSEQIEEN